MCVCTCIHWKINICNYLLTTYHYPSSCNYLLTTYHTPLVKGLAIEGASHLDRNSNNNG